MIKTFFETSITVTAPNGILIRFTFPGPTLSPMHLHSLQLQGGGHQRVRDPGASLTSSTYKTIYLFSTLFKGHNYQFLTVLLKLYCHHYIM